MEHVSGLSSDLRGISNRVSPLVIGNDAIMPYRAHELCLVTTT